MAAGGTVAAGAASAAAAAAVMTAGGAAVTAAAAGHAADTHQLFRLSTSALGAGCLFIPENKLFKGVTTLGALKFMDRHMISLLPVHPGGPIPAVGISL